MIQSKNSTSRPRAKDKQVKALAALAVLCILNGAVALAQAPAQRQAQSLAQLPASPPQQSVSAAQPSAQSPARQPFSSSDGLSFADRLSRLESANGLGQSSPDVSILDRIGRIEQRVFGQPRQGSIVDRLKGLEASRSSIQGQPQAQGQQLAPFAQGQQQMQGQQLAPFAQGQSQMQGQPLAPFAQGQAQGQPINQAFNQPPVWVPRQGQPGFPIQPPNNMGQQPNNIGQPSPQPFGQGGAPPGAAGRSMADIIKSAHVASIVTLPNIYPPSFLHMPLATDDSRDNSDFLDAVMAESKNKVLRFQKMPIPIYITPPQDPTFAKAIREGFEDWNRRTGGMINFFETPNKDNARIIVIFNRLGIASGNDCSLGAHTVTKWKSRGSGKLAFLPMGAIPVPLYIPQVGPKYTVPPQVIEVNLDVIYGHDQDVRLLLLKNIATHELGHALGMLGHSPNEADMMYKITDEHSRLSQRDINTVSRLYKLKADIPL